MYGVYLVNICPAAKCEEKGYFEEAAGFILGSSSMALFIAGKFNCVDTEGLMITLHLLFRSLQ